MEQIIANLMSLSPPKPKGHPGAKQINKNLTESFIGRLRGALAASSKQGSGGIAKSLSKKASANLGPSKPISALHQALLRKGQSLEKMSIELKELPELAQFLLQNGWSAKDVVKVVQNLSKTADNGRIKLSQFFSAVDENRPTTTKKKSQLAAVPAVVPFIEIQLRRFDLGPKTISNLINSAQDAKGRINLKRLAVALEQSGSEIKNPEKKSALTSFIKALNQAVSLADQSNGQMATRIKTLVGEKQVVENAQTLQQLLAMGNAVESKNKTTSTDGISSTTSLAGELTEATQASIDRIVAKTGSDKKVDQAQALHQQARMKMAATHTAALNDPKKAAEVDTKAHAFNEVVQQLEGNDAEIDESALQAFSNLKAASSGNSQELRPPIQPPMVDNAKTPVAVTQPQAIGTVEDVKATQAVPRPAANEMPAYLLDQVSRQMSRAMLRGDRTLKIQLKPPELGIIKIEMDVQHNSLKVNMVAESSTVKDLLMSNVAELRETLNQQGIKIDNVDVQVNNNQDRSLADSRQNSGNGSAHNGKSNPEGAGLNENETQGIDPNDMMADDHMVSLVA